MEKCVLCKEIIDSGHATVVLTEKGVTGVLKASVERGDSLDVKIGQKVHTVCRKRYINTKVKKGSTLDVPGVSIVVPKLRSNSNKYSHSDNCILCTMPADVLDHDNVHPVKTFTFQDTITSIAKKRNDSWGQEVLGRIQFVNDLHAADVVYHQACCINFRTGKNIPKKFAKESNKSLKTSSAGRPSNIDQLDAFFKVVDHLETNREELLSVPDLCDMMKTFMGGDSSNAYSTVWMKWKLNEHFGNRIVIGNVHGKPNVVTFTNNANTILTEFFCKPRTADTEAEKARLISTVVKLLQHDIKTIERDNSVYPTSDEMSNVDEALSFLPQSLSLLLKGLLPPNNNIKVAAIGQSIVQAVRPRAFIAPLQLGLAVQMHHHFGSKFLVESLHSQGFCSSYKEVQAYEKCAAVAHGTDLPMLAPGQFIQHVADNVDHNVRTLDGLDTFHGMGIIATVTPSSKISFQIPKMNVTLDDIKAVGRIPIVYYQSVVDETRPYVYKQLPIIDGNYPSDYHFLWKVSYPLILRRPMWAGYMHMLLKGTYPGESEVVFMPMIDMNPSDPTCIYSTMLFVCQQSAKYKCTPVLTFDQPLWWKAFTIVHNEPVGSPLKCMMLRLGGFHIQMSFLGSIGNLMSGSGLAEVLQVIFAENTVPHLMSGKAVSRAVRGHLIMDSALNALLLSKAYDIDPLPSNNDFDQDEAMPDSDLSDVIGVRDMIKTSLCESETFNINSVSLKNLMHKIEVIKTSLAKSRTAS